MLADIRGKKVKDPRAGWSPEHRAIYAHTCPGCGVHPGQLHKSECPDSKSATSRRIS